MYICPRIGWHILWHTSHHSNDTCVHNSARHPPITTVCLKRNSKLSFHNIYKCTLCIFVQCVHKSIGHPPIYTVSRPHVICNFWFGNLPWPCVSVPARVLCFCISSTHLRLCCVFLYIFDACVVCCGAEKKQILYIQDKFERSDQW